MLVSNEFPYSVCQLLISIAHRPTTQYSSASSLCSRSAYVVSHVVAPLQHAVAAAIDCFDSPSAQACIWTPMVSSPFSLDPLTTPVGMYFTNIFNPKGLSFEKRGVFLSGGGGGGIACAARATFPGWVGILQVCYINARLLISGLSATYLQEVQCAMAISFLMNRSQLRQSAVHGEMPNKHTYTGNDRFRVSNKTSVRILRPSVPDLATSVAPLHHRSDHSVLRRIPCYIIVLL